jgi:hypothetical protein
VVRRARLRSNHALAFPSVHGGLYEAAGSLLRVFADARGARDDILGESLELNFLTLGVQLRGLLFARSGWDCGAVLVTVAVIRESGVRSPSCATTMRIHSIERPTSQPVCLSIITVVLISRCNAKLEPTSH